MTPRTEDIIRKHIDNEFFLRQYLPKIQAAMIEYAKGCMREGLRVTTLQAEQLIPPYEVTQPQVAFYKDDQWMVRVVPDCLDETMKNLE